MSDAHTVVFAPLCVQRVDGACRSGSESMQVLQNGNVVRLDLRRRHGVICEDILGPHGAGERHVIHPFLLLVHLVLVPVENNDVLEFQTLGRVNGGEKEVCILHGIVLLCLLVLRGEKRLLDGVLADFIANHVVLDEVKHVVDSHLSVADLVDPSFDFGALFSTPFEQHFLNLRRCLLVCINQVGETSHDFPNDDIYDVGIRSKLDVVPVFLDEGGHHGRVVHLFGNQTDTATGGILCLKYLLDGGNILAGEGQDGDLFTSLQTLLNVGSDFMTENLGQFLMEFTEFLQLVIVEPDVVQEALLGHSGEAVSLQLNLSILVGFDVLESHVGKVQDFLARTIVDVELVGGEGAGAFQDIQCTRVGGTELVERLTAIAYNEKGLLVLIHIFQSIDELEDGVVLHLVDNEELAGDGGRLDERVYLLIADDNLQLQGGLVNGVQHLDDFIVMFFDEVVHLSKVVGIILDHCTQSALEFGNNASICARGCRIIDIDAVDDGVQTGQLMVAEVGRIDFMNHTGNGHGMNIGVLCCDIVSSSVGEAQDCDVFGFDP